MKPTVPCARSATWIALTAAACALMATPAVGQASRRSRPDPANAPTTAPAAVERDYEVREVMIPMRDGVRLHTLIILPKGAVSAPTLLTRTPFDAAARLDLEAQHRVDLLPRSEALFMADDYIRVFQDIRGKNGSEGDFTVTRPPRGPSNASQTDDATDAYDTIDWLVKNLAQSNGRVGMIGSSYEGWTVAMALTDPHPALKAAVPENPMIDGWVGDDWFHNGAFRQVTLDYLSFEVRQDILPRDDRDDYDAFLQAGSASDMARKAGLTDHPFWRSIVDHPAYDDRWRSIALDRLLETRPLRVPTLWVGALWDQEDGYGAVAGYAAQEANDRNNDTNFLVLGPWRHGGMNGDGSSLGELKFGQDTGLQFRRDILKPFLDQRLKSAPPPGLIAPVTIFETGANQWRMQAAWPSACAAPCPSAGRLYLRAAGGLSSDRPQTSEAAFDAFVSDPAAPVPYAPRPVRSDQDQWRTWMVADQRFVAGRTDVVSFTAEPLAAAERVAGSPVAHLFASTTGQDADWVVKVIDVYPDDDSVPRELRGFELMVSADILRGRYRADRSRAMALRPGEVSLFELNLPAMNHVFLAGHRIKIQVQSSWFPLYDRNPQSSTANIFNAGPGAYQSQTHRVFHSPAAASSIDLPIVRKGP